MAFFIIMNHFFIETGFLCLLEFPPVRRI